MEIVKGLMDVQDQNVALQDKVWTYPVVTLRYLFLPALKRIASFCI